VKLEHERAVKDASRSAACRLYPGPRAVHKPYSASYLLRLLAWSLVYLPKARRDRVTRDPRRPAGMAVRERGIGRVVASRGAVILAPAAGDWGRGEVAFEDADSGTWTQSTARDRQLPASAPPSKVPAGAQARRRGAPTLGSTVQAGSGLLRVRVVLMTWRRHPTPNRDLAVEIRFFGTAPHETAREAVLRDMTIPLEVLPARSVSPDQCAIGERATRLVDGRLPPVSGYGSALLAIAVASDPTLTELLSSVDFDGPGLRRRCGRGALLQWPSAHVR